MVDWPRARRGVIRQLAQVRRQLAAAEAALATAKAEMARAEAEFDAAGHRVARAEGALDTAQADWDSARQQRYAARQAHQRAGTAVERLQRGARDAAERLDRMPPLTAPGPAGAGRTATLSGRDPAPCQGWAGGTTTIIVSSTRCVPSLA
ncbi:MAG TPA: hypothetical protein VIX86_12285 [Streptosporangiaceae bacterium]